MKNNRTVHIAHDAFPFSFFHLVKEKTKIGIADHISIFSIFCLWIRKRNTSLYKGCLPNSFKHSLFKVYKVNLGLYQLCI